ncbi:hypothetical protein LUZ60_000015 [Juncus effusus]|nr:hypothetical protein LUZ60_000015 [Juncus effusus]
MAPLLFLFLSLLLLFSAPAKSDDSRISAIISSKGVDFTKDLLVNQAVKSMIPLELADIEKSARIPFVGYVTMFATDLDLYELNVANSSAIIGDSSVEIVASGVTAEMSMNWNYSYSTAWIRFSDCGNASVEVVGMEVSLTMSMKAKNGSVQLKVSDVDCEIQELIITLSGGASWFYQGFINAFKNHIRQAVEKAIIEKVTDGSSQLDSLLQQIPKEFSLDGISYLNLSLVQDPVYSENSVEIDINGLFNGGAKNTVLRENRGVFLSCGGESKMGLVSVDQQVFNSFLNVYYQAGYMNWYVDKIPKQSLLNTSSWKILIPELYTKYPNEEMMLNISISSSPVVTITGEKISSTLYADVLVDVLDQNQIVSVALVQVEVIVSGNLSMSGNNITGKMEIDDFTLTLKWSNVGSLYLTLIQGVIWVFLNDILKPLVNMLLGLGYNLPSVYGFSLQNPYIYTSNSTVYFCSDVAYSNSTEALLYALRKIM